MGKVYLFMNHGGMGNQMYQYAVARKLQEKYDADIICDLSKYAYNGTDATQRPYVLDRFYLTDRMEYKICKFHKLISAVKRRILAKKCAGMSAEQRFAVFTENGIYFPGGYFECFPESRVKVRNIYVNGLFQAHGFFDDIVPILQKEFRLKEPSSEEVSSLMAQMECENSVCVHWRRGDYLDPKYASSLLVCDDRYYDRAMEEVAARVVNAVFYVFTNSAEDAEYIRDHHDFPYPVRYVNLMLAQEHDDVEDFAIMRACRHYVISNSTFSWWAQYLSDAPEKVVCAPAVWNRQANADGLYQSNWVTIPVE